VAGTSASAFFKSAFIQMAFSLFSSSKELKKERHPEKGGEKKYAKEVKFLLNT
jgi:hypothetical protein